MDDRFVDLESVVDLSDIIDALQDLSAEELLRTACRPTARGTRSTTRCCSGPTGCRSRRGGRATRTTSG